MNNKNAALFIVMGLLMHLMPQWGIAVDGTMSGEGTVRTIWLAFMSWVVGGVGLVHYTHETWVRIPGWMQTLLPARMLQPMGASGEPQLAVRVAATY